MRCLELEALILISCCQANTEKWRRRRRFAMGWSNFNHIRALRPSARWLLPKSWKHPINTWILSHCCNCLYRLCPAVFFPWPGCFVLTLHLIRVLHILPSYDHHHPRQNLALGLLLRNVGCWRGLVRRIWMNFYGIQQKLHCRDAPSSGVTLSRELVSFLPERLWPFTEALASFSFIWCRSRWFGPKLSSEWRTSQPLQQAGGRCTRWPDSQPSRASWT